jgi:hypothetical protein
MVTMETRVEACEVHDDNQQKKEDHETDPKHPPPAWCAGGRSRIRSDACVVVGPGVARRASHGRLLEGVQSLRSVYQDIMSFSNQFVLPPAQCTLT